MGYISRILIENEKLIILTRPHWIYLMEGAVFFVILLVLGFVTDHYIYETFGKNIPDFQIDLGFLYFDARHTPIPWLFGFAGLAIFLPLFILWVGNEIALTDQRIIHKRGIIFVNIDEIDLEDIRAEHVSHGFLGWILGYGRIRMNCRFIEDVHIPAIKHPYKFIKLSHKARLHNPSIAYDDALFGKNMVRIERQKTAQKALMEKKYKALKAKIMKSFGQAQK